MILSFRLARLSDGSSGGRLALRFRQARDVRGGRCLQERGAGFRRQSRLPSALRVVLVHAWHQSDLCSQL